MVEAGNNWSLGILVVLTTCVASSGCAGFENPRAGHVVRAEVGYAYPEKASFSDYDVGDRHQQHLFGVRLGYEYVSPRGRFAGAGLSFAQGMLAEKEGIHQNSDVSSYQLFAVGTQVGWRSGWLGLAVGGTFLLGSEMLWSFYPQLHLEIAPIRWFGLEGGIGAPGPMFDGRIAYGGIQLHLDGLDAHLGFAGVAHFVPNLVSDYDNLPFFNHGPMVLGGYALCDFYLSDRFFLHLGVIGASSPAFRVGIGVRL